MGYPLKITITESKLEIIHKSIFEWYNGDNIEFFPMNDGIGVSISSKNLSSNTNVWNDIVKILNLFFNHSCVVYDLYTGGIIDESNIEEFKKNLGV